MQFFLQDSAAYFYKDDLRRQIKQRLVAQIPSGGEPFILVSHSQGTVAAFEVLTELGLDQRPTAALLVTMGSPLGLQEVEDELQEAEFQTGCAAWRRQLS